MIWPTIDKPDLALSVGTGSTKPPDSPTTQFLRGVFIDGFCSRAFRSFWFSPSLHSENSWQMCLDSLDRKERDRFFKPNFLIEDGKVDLDDIEQMIPLQPAVRAHVSRHSFQDIVRALWCSSFYFELDETPEYCGGQYLCRGAILSHLEDCTISVRNVLEAFPEAAFQMVSGASLGRLDVNSCCWHCGFFHWPVAFGVRLLSEQVKITLCLNVSAKRQISALPASMQWFVRQQGLNRQFGCPDHRPCFLWPTFIEVETIFER